MRPQGDTTSYLKSTGNHTIKYYIREQLKNQVQKHQTFNQRKWPTWPRWKWPRWPWWCISTQGRSRQVWSGQVPSACVCTLLTAALQLWGARKKSLKSLASYCTRSVVALWSWEIQILQCGFCISPVWAIVYIVMFAQTYTKCTQRQPFKRGVPRNPWNPP